jgi:hypothetical protein
MYKSHFAKEKEDRKDKRIIFSQELQNTLFAVKPTRGSARE